MRILQINTIVNAGSTGRITEDIGCILLDSGHESYIAYGRGADVSKSELMKIGNHIDVYRHGIVSLLFDRHGFSSRRATLHLIKRIEEISPDIISLHNVHGYYLNIEILFNYLRRSNIPVVWTLHDCWSFTGHCSFFDKVDCQKWKTGCSHCELKRTYPSSLLFDNSGNNFIRKKELFNQVHNMDLVVYSQWLKNKVEESFLSNHPVYKIHSGIDLNIFKPQTNDIRELYKIDDREVILGCANIWNNRKGLDDFLYLKSKFANRYNIVLVGLTRKQINNLPHDIIGIERTRNVEELASLYSLADIFVNPTTADNFPTTNIEALACGTPVVTYNTGGSGEAVDDRTGIVVNKSDKQKLYEAVAEVIGNGKKHYMQYCRERAEAKFNKEDRYRDYIKLFEQKIRLEN